MIFAPCKFIAFIFLILFLSACPSAFQPPPDAYEHWTRKNTSKEDTEKILLECGYPSIRGEGLKATDNEVALMHICMESKGFKYQGEYGPYCKFYPSLPACVEARKEAAAQKSKKTN